MPRIRPLSTTWRYAFVGGGVTGFSGGKLGGWLAANDLLSGIPDTGD